MPAKLIRLPRSFEARFSPDGRFCAVLDQSIRILDARTGRTIDEFAPFHSTLDVAFSNDSTALIVHTEFEFIIGTLQPSGKFQWQALHNPCHADAQFSPCGNFILSASPGYGFTRWNWKTGIADLRYNPPGVRASLLRSARGDGWVSVHCRRGKLKADDPSTWFIHWPWPIEAATAQELPYRVPGVEDSALSPDGDLLAVMFSPTKRPGRKLQIYSLSRRMILHDQPGGNEASTHLRWSPCGRYLSYPNYPGFDVLDFHAREIFARYAAEDPSALDFSPDGQRVALSATDGRIEPFPPKPAAKRPRSRRK